MSTPQGSTEAHDEPGRYEVPLKGHVDERWAERFAGLTFSHAGDSTTVLIGPVVDQAALYGLLRTVRDLALPLLSVRELGPTQASGSDGDADTDHTQASRTETQT